MLSRNWQEGVLSELLYADDLVLMNEIIDGLWEAFCSNTLKLNLGRSRVLSSGVITQNDLANSNLCPCAICKANSILRV